MNFPVNIQRTRYISVKTDEDIPMDGQIELLLLPLFRMCHQDHRLACVNQKVIFNCRIVYRWEF